MSPTYWLCSYPKSGNTWFRIVMANLWSGSDAPIDINAISSTDSITSSRHKLEHHALVDTGLLDHDEADHIRPLFYAYAARGGIRADPDQDARLPVRFVKSHDGYTRLPDGKPMLAGEQGARGAILFVRDPRDVAASFANHLNCPIDKAIDHMADPDFCFATRGDRQHPQLRQQLLGWSGFAQSWLDQRDIPVHLIRYEDMAADPHATVRAALDFCGIAADPTRIDRAIAFASIDELQRQESEKGFREAPRKCGSFFRRGAAGGWHDDLTELQSARIEHEHRATMLRLGYHLSEPVAKRQSA